MTSITLIGGIDMIGTFSTRRYSIVTTDARTGNFSVIDSVSCDRNPGGRKALVAGVTGVGRRNMVRGFATGGNTVMTSNAISGKISVINNRTAYPVLNIVASITFIRSGNMICTLTGCDNIIMAT